MILTILFVVVLLPFCWQLLRIWCDRPGVVEDPRDGRWRSARLVWKERRR